MQIMIKTHAEFQEDHVTIEIRGDRAEIDAALSKLPGRNLFTEEEVQDLLKNQAAKSAGTIAGLRDRLSDVLAENERASNWGHETETKLAESRELVAFKDRVADEMGEELERLRAKVAELTMKAAVADKEADAQRERADQNKEWAERAETRLTEVASSLASRDRLLTEATKDRGQLADRLSKVSQAVHGRAIGDALRTTWSTLEARALAQAVREVRRVVDVHKPNTSQA